MARQVQLRRGTTAENDNFIGAAGELTFDMSTGAVRAHDGTKQGGHILDSVVAYQLPTSENNYTWYRKYASGWVDQGGYKYVGATTASTAYTITLPVPMASTVYQVIFGQLHSSSGSGVWGGESYNNRTSTTISLFCGSAGWYGYYWEVHGLAA